MSGSYKLLVIKDIPLQMNAHTWQGSSSRLTHPNQLPKLSKHNHKRALVAEAKLAQAALCSQKHVGNLCASRVHDLMQNGVPGVRIIFWPPTKFHS